MFRFQVKRYAKTQAALFEICCWNLLFCRTMIMHTHNPTEKLIFNTLHWECMHDTCLVHWDILTCFCWFNKDQIDKFKCKIKVHQGIYKTQNVLQNSEWISFTVNLRHAWPETETETEFLFLFLIFGKYVWNFLVNCKIMSPYTCKPDISHIFK